MACGARVCGCRARAREAASTPPDMSVISTATRANTDHASDTPSVAPSSVLTTRAYTGCTEAPKAHNAYASTIAVEYGRCSFAMTNPFASHSTYAIRKYIDRSSVESIPSQGRSIPFSSVALNTSQITYPMAIARAASHLCATICENG